MRNVSLQRRIEAPQAAVWGVLADFPNIARWNSGISTSYAIGDATTGVGARRHCDLRPAGGLDETVREWEPESKMVISIDEASRLPIRHGVASFELTGDAEATDLTFSYDYEPRGGPMGRVVGPLLDRQLARGFEGFVDDLEAAARVAAP